MWAQFTQDLICFALLMVDSIMFWLILNQSGRSFSRGMIMTFFSRVSGSGVVKILNDDRFLGLVSGTTVFFIFYQNRFVFFSRVRIRVF